MYRNPDRRLAVQLIVLGIFAALVQLGLLGEGGVSLLDEARWIDAWPLTFALIGAAILARSPHLS